jgi:hypothetical protein
MLPPEMLSGLFFAEEDEGIDGEGAAGSGQGSIPDDHPPKSI